MHQHSLFAAVNRAITKKGLYVLLLIRVAPYPYNVCSPQGRAWRRRRAHWLFRKMQRLQIRMDAFYFCSTVEQVGFMLIKFAASAPGLGPALNACLDAGHGQKRPGNCLH
jgi:hypothetical protein